MQDLNKLYQKVVYAIRKYEDRLNEEEAAKLKLLVSARLKLYRAKHRLTQKQLAEQLGVSRMEVIRWENKLFEPREKTIQLLIEKGILADLERI